MFQNAHLVMAYIKIISHCNYDIYYIFEEQSYILSSVESISKCSYIYYNQHCTRLEWSVGYNKYMFIILHGHTMKSKCSFELYC